MSDPADYLLHTLTLMFQNGRGYDEVQQEILEALPKVREHLVKRGKEIKTPHGTLLLVESPKLK